MFGAQSCDHLEGGSKANSKEGQYIFTRIERRVGDQLNVGRDGQELGQLKSMEPFTGELISQRAVGRLAEADSNPGDIVVLAAYSDAGAEDCLHQPRIAIGVAEPKEGKPLFAEELLGSDGDSPTFRSLSLLPCIGVPQGCVNVVQVDAIASGGQAQFDIAEVLVVFKECVKAC